MIFHLTGKKGAALDVVANALRNSQIAGGKGATIIEATSSDDLRQAQLEKLIVGPLVPANGGKQAWKAEPMVIIVGADPNPALAAIDALAPGAVKALGPFHMIEVR